MDVTFNEWGKADIVVPDFLKDIRDGVNSVAEFLLTVLNIANEVLEVVKNFVFDIANPINAILKELLGLVSSLLNDLRNLGVYVYKDSLETPKQKLDGTFVGNGGYSGFEERMLGAMLNAQDPNNPVFLFSENTAVYALFFYQSYPLSRFNDLKKAWDDLLNLFSATSNRPEPIPIDLEFEYLKKEGSDYLKISNSAGVDANGVPANALRVSWAYPNGAEKPSKVYLDISTFKDGLMPFYEKRAPNATSSDLFLDRAIDTEYTPLNLYGKYDGGDPKLKFFSSADKPPVDDPNKYQTTIEIDTEAGFFSESRVSHTFDFNLLPEKVEKVFYVRVRLDVSPFVKAKKISKPLEVKKPESLREFADLLTHAFYTLILTSNTLHADAFARAHKKYGNDFRGLNRMGSSAGYEGAVQSISRTLAKKNLEKFTTMPSSTREFFVDNYLGFFQGFVAEVRSKILSPSAQVYLEDNIMKKPNVSPSTKSKVAKYTKSAVLYVDGVAGINFTPIEEELNSRPLVLEGTAKLLNILCYTESPASAWESYRFFPRVFPDVEEILQEVNDFVESMLAGFKGIVDALVQYIESIQSRIAELQNFILRITALLNALLVKINSVASFSALLVEAQGGKGLLQNFINADSKPQDDLDDVGAGIAVVFGGVPTLLIDTFKFVKENVINEGEQGDNAEEPVKELPDGLEF